jgi:hypothetical protein
MDCLDELILRISPNKFHYLKFILEGYDNMATLSSLDSREGFVIVRYHEKLTKDLFDLLTSIATKVS